MASRDLLHFVHVLLLLLVFVASVVRGFNAGNEITDAMNMGPHPINKKSDEIDDSSNMVVNRRAASGPGEGDTPRPTSRPSSSTTTPSFVNRDSCGSEFMFRCDNGQCISKNFLCDGGGDCSDGSDEKNCPQKGHCTLQQFKCDNNKRCIDIHLKCNGHDDCTDNSDEEGCEVTCPSDQFRCQSGECIVADAVCDKFFDCEHNDDEANCKKSHCLRIPGHYQCQSGGDCVPPTKVCDNVTDCNDGTDEGLACATTCGNDNCTQDCYPTPKGPHCSCKQGFLLERDTVTCSDEDECAWSTKLACDHFCKNTAGGFQCSCHEEYNLQEDKVTCRHKLNRNAFLLVAQDDGIRQLYLDGSYDARITYTANSTTIGLGYDPVTRHVFYSSFGLLYKAKLEPNAISERILRDGIITPEGLAVDWTARNLYLTDPKMNHILVCTLDISSCYQLKGNLGHPRAIQLDIANRLMYWTDVKDGKIHKAGMDGSHYDVVVKDDILWPNALALDLPAGRLYWLDANTDRAFTVKLDGTDRKSLHLAVLKHPYSMALWEDHLYWTDWTKKALSSCIKRDGKHKQTLLRGSHKNQFFGLCLYHPAMKEDITNPCANAKCSHLCLLSPDAPGYKCQCPTGIMELHRDNRTCVDLPNRVHMIVNSYKKMYLFSPHKFGHPEQHAFVPGLDIADIGDVEYSPKQDLVFVSDQRKAKVYTITVNEGVSILMTFTVARSMALDWLRNNLYWLSSGRKVLVVKLENYVATYRKVIIDDLPNPISIAVAPLLGYLFVSGASSEPRSPGYIKKCGLDGSLCTTLVATNIMRPVSLVMDHTHNYLYWCDYPRKSVERIDPSGMNRLALVGTHTRHVPRKHVTSLVVTVDRLYFTLEGALNVYTITTNASNMDFQILKGDLDSMQTDKLGLHIVKWKLSKSQSEQQVCRNNGGCSEICVGNAHQQEVCLCGSSSQLEADGKSCSKKRVCGVHMFQCVSNLNCVSGSFRCDGVEDCDDGSDETDCLEKCPPNHYKCNTTDGCVHVSKLCDGHSDCDDASDEKGSCSRVPTTNCHGHKCDGTKCILRLQLCDGHADCSDRSDEANCTSKKCPPNNKLCLSGECIHNLWVCDGHEDCRDGSDEKNCPVNCPTGHFSCEDKCIHNILVCNGRPDCKDGKDESAELCETHIQTCPEGKIACLLENPKAELVCIDHKDQCNGVVDCPLREDESVKACPVCKMNEFLCPSNSCIPISYLCDGDPDCDDGADEGPAANCTRDVATPWTPTTTIGSCGEDFMCEDGTCLTYSMVCDGERDCPDGSDEKQSCEILCKSKMCEHRCRPTPHKAFCYCHRGYHLAPDNRSCLDDNECKDETRCSQICEELPGYFLCTCLPGYELSDPTTCKRIAGGEWLVMTWQEGILNMTNLYHHENISIIPDLGDVGNFAVDPITGNILYSDGKRNVVAMLTKSPDGGMKETILWRRNNPGPVCYDSHRRNVYVVETFKKSGTLKEGSIVSSWSHGSAAAVGLWSTIMACNLDDKRCGFIYGSNNSVVPSVAVSLRETRLFFCTKFWAVERGLIMTSNLDGTGMLEIRKKVVWCGSVAVDEAKRRVYWTDIALNSVESVTWEGESHHVHRQQNEVWYPVGLAVVGPNVLWANLGDRMLLICPKSDGGECTQIPLPVVPHGLFAAPVSLVPEKDQCRNVSCTQMCVSGESCGLCWANYRRSSTDPTKCEKLNTCDVNDCEGQSECEAHTSDKYVCRCPAGRSGLSCEHRDHSAQTSATSGNVVTTVVVVVILLVLLLVVLGCVYWYKRRPFTFWKSRGSRARDRVYHFVNPAFGVMHDQPIIESDDSPESTMSAQRTYRRPPPSAPSSPSTTLMKDQEQQQQLDYQKHKEDSQINTSGDSAVASTTDSFLAQHTDVNLSTPFIQYGANVEDGDLELNFSPFNPTKV